MPLKYQVPDDKKVRVIVDSDAACEADDPFAIAHALLCDKFIVKAIFAEHFNSILSGKTFSIPFLIKRYLSFAAAHRLPAVLLYLWLFH